MIYLVLVIEALVCFMLGTFYGRKLEAVAAAERDKVKAEFRAAVDKVKAKL